MSDEDLSDNDGNINIYPSLDTIPVEVFLHICSFIDGKELIGSLKKVCKSFYEILSDDSTWRTWLKHRWPDFPVANLCYKDGEIPSTKLCLHIDRAFTLWNKDESKFTKWSDDSTHIATVDAVKLIQGGRIAISGSRDRSLAVWDTTDRLQLLQTAAAHSGWIWSLAYCPQTQAVLCLSPQGGRIAISGSRDRSLAVWDTSDRLKLLQTAAAHSGWIWSLAYCPQTQALYSCSWDALVKLWALEEGLQEKASFKCKTAVLAGAARPGLVAAGLFSPEVDVFDPRAGGEQVAAYRAHSRSIMSLAIVRDYIVSASEDQTLSVWDLTAGKVFKSGIQVSKEGHPMTLSYSGGNLLFIGDTTGRLHILDTQHDSFQLVDSFDLGHQSRQSTITAMWHDPGCVLSSSKDASVRVHTTTRPPHLLTRLTSAHGDITAMDFADPVLFVGCANSAVEMWKP